VAALLAVFCFALLPSTASQGPELKLRKLASNHEVTAFMVHDFSFSMYFTGMHRVDEYDFTCDPKEITTLLEDEVGSRYKNREFILPSGKHAMFGPRDDKPYTCSLEVETDPGWWTLVVGRLEYLLGR